MVILEATATPLSKVAISGGGRCNVTHACFERTALLAQYPRGARALRGPFARFQPQDTIAWFAARGVTLKTEADGRMFPVTDSSATIVDALRNAAQRAGVELRVASPVRALTSAPENPAGFTLSTAPGELTARHVILCTGGSRHGHELAAALGHTITPLAPSLFTFKVSDPRLDDLAGLSVENAQIRVDVPGADPLTQRGPLLITHWGLSGPAVLRLSAWGARELAAVGYRAELRIAWLGQADLAAARAQLDALRADHPRAALTSQAPPGLPRRLWERLVTAAVQTTGPIPATWSQASRPLLVALARELAEGRFALIGKGPFKEEFVTCGGIASDEIDWTTMASRRVPGLFIAGEILDVDGITGGFNFQNAWTTGWIAGHAVAQRISATT